MPTMGALHEGHYSLMRTARQECDYVVVSIFVNPTQFAPNEDLAAYPRTFEADKTGCENEGVDLIFAPAVNEMYPRENLTWIDVDKMGTYLCGAARPGHFRGVCTVVAKLFNIVAPDIAYFGQKDAQQVAIIERMAADLNMPVEVRRCPTVREADGLALSSRNRYLNSEQRRQGLSLARALHAAEQMIGAGERNAGVIISAMKEIVEAEPEAAVDYISIVDSDLLRPVEIVAGKVLIALAVKIGPARLIDNILVDPAG